jgi:hypothetical protein
VGPRRPSRVGNRYGRPGRPPPRVVNRLDPFSHGSFRAWFPVETNARKHLSRVSSPQRLVARCLNSSMVIVWSAPLRYGAGRSAEKLRNRAVVGAHNCLARHADELSGQREFEAGHHRRPFSWDRVSRSYGRRAKTKTLRALHSLMKEIQQCMEMASDPSVFVNFTDQAGFVCRRLGRSLLMVIEEVVGGDGAVTQRGFAARLSSASQAVLRVPTAALSSTVPAAHRTLSTGAQARAPSSCAPRV